MAVTDLTAWGLPSGVNYPLGLSKRPPMRVAWDTGTGPFDVLHEWDTVSTFDSGNLITDNNVGVTSPDDGVPPSDMSAGTWYYRATIKDGADYSNEIQTIAIAEQHSAPTATASHNNNLAPLCVDDNESTEWDSWSTTQTGAVLQVDFDFGSAVSIGRMKLLQSHDTFFCDSVKVYWSDDGSGYTLVGTFSSLVSGWNTLDFASLSHRYWRIEDNGSVATFWRLQEVDFFGFSTGGTWRLSYDSNATSDLDDQISFAALETALEGLTGITAVTATGTVGKDYVVEFTDPADTDMLMLVVDDDSLTPTAIAITVVETEKGREGTDDVYPPSGTHTIVMVESYDTPWYLYLYKNIIPGIEVGEVDDRIERPRFLYLYKNAVPGFDRDEIDDRIEVPRSLYLYKKITTDQPCPYLWYVAPVLVSAGNTITLTGDSFGATPSTWGGEVRLYDAQGYGGSYTTLSTTSWSDTQIVAIVPSGASSGWVGVVHTTGTPTCTGSAQKLITVLQVEPDPEAGWYVVASNPKNTTVEAIDSTILRAKIKPTMNAIGSGRIDMPLGDLEGIDRLIDPATRTGTLLKVYLDSRFRYGFYAEKLRHEYEEEGEGGIAIIEGRGMEVVTKHMMVFAHDYPASPSLSPTWIYGSTDNLIENASFEDDTEVLSNPGGEDGNDDDGHPEGWSTRGDDVDDYTGVQDSLEARTDDWYIEVDTSGSHSGLTQSVAVTPNKRYHVTVYVKEPTASGQRITLALGGADDISATGTYTNNFVYNNEVLAELGNVPRNAGSNGCPGGATDGTWQVMDVEVTTGDEQTSLTITVQDDHHPGCAAVTRSPWRIDDLAIVGYGLGLEPWIGRNSQFQAADSFRLSNDQVVDGSYSCYIDATQNTAGVEQKIEVNPSTKYTLSCWIWPTGTTDLWNLDIVEADGTGVLAQESRTPTAHQWNLYEVIYTMPDDVEEVIIRFTYQGPGNPPGVLFDSFAMVPGEPAAPAGKILIDLLDPIQARGTGDFIGVSFTETLDSKGRPWNANLAMDITAGESIYSVLSRLVALGHEWNLVPTNFDEGGDTGFELNVYNSRGFDPDSGLGTSWIGDPEGPVIAPGNATIGGRIVKQVFNVNVVHAIGEDGAWSEANQEPFSGAGGYEESFGRIEDVIQAGSSSDPTTLSQFAEARIDDEFDKELQLQVKMQRSSSLRPFLNFGVGDSLYVDLPPYLADETHENPKRIRAISADLKDEGSAVTFRVDIDRVVYEDELAGFVAIAQLKERAPSENTGQGTGSVSAAGSVTTGTGAATAVAAPHSHLLNSTEIKNKTLTGDASGTLPGPVTVNALKGRPVSNVIPADTGGDVLMSFDRDLSTWVPGEFTVAGGGLTHQYLGTSTVGTTWAATATRYVHFKKITVPTGGGIISAIEVRLRATVANIGALQLALYDDDSGSPKELIGLATVMTNDKLYFGNSSVERWFAMPIGRYVAAGDYWIAFQQNDSLTGIQIAQETTGGSDKYHISGGDWISDGNLYSLSSTTVDWSMRASLIT